MAFSGDYMSVDINKIVLRLANENDAEVLALIYKPYVENTAVSFEYDAPNITQFAKRI